MPPPAVRRPEALLPEGAKHDNMHVEVRHAHVPKTDPALAKLQGDFNQTFEEAEPETRKVQAVSKKRLLDPSDDRHRISSPGNPKSSNKTGLFITLGVLGVTGILAVTIGRPLVQKWTATPAASVSGSTERTSDGRLEKELQVAEKARDEGNYVTARESFSRATVIDEKSQKAWDGLCTSESELAMMHWIAALATSSSLEREQASTIGIAAGKSCARWAELIRPQADGSAKVSEDMRPARALAAQSDAPGVRLFLVSHPGSALLEGLVTLADSAKKDIRNVSGTIASLGPVLQRMNVNELKAPSELAWYVFIASSLGQAQKANDAWMLLSKIAPKYLLLEVLRQASTVSTVDAGVRGDAGTTDAGVVKFPSSAWAIGTTAATSTTATAVVAATGANTASAAPTATESAAPTGVDAKELTNQGNQALASGDVGKAESSFKQALAAQPGNISAMYGLGQIARARGDHSGAVNYFKGIVDSSPGFTPARLALADEQWAMGNRGEAIGNYEAYLQRVSEGSGAERARSRIGSVKGPAPQPKTTPSTSAKP